MTVQSNQTRLLMVGSGSFLARQVIAVGGGRFHITAIPHDTAFENLDFSQFDAVINMAYDPRYKTAEYDAGLDMDMRVATALAGKGPHFYMMSSRRVYGFKLPFPADENAPLLPDDTYGRNKKTTEALLQKLLGSRCTILRIANVFGFEYGRRSFFGTALTTLKHEGRIVLDVSPFMRRDFIPAPLFAERLIGLVEKSPSGIFNIGSEQAIPVGQIALWIIEGFGRGELVVTNPREHDCFLLDCGRLNTAIGRSPQADIRDYCLQIGRKLRDA